jgi:hypothetical protein
MAPLCVKKQQGAGFWDWYWRVREVACPQSWCGDVSRPRWSQSRFPCETCSFVQTSIEFRPTLQAPHDDAAAKGQHYRADIFDQLVTGITEGEAS